MYTIGITRKFKAADYEDTLNLPGTLREGLPARHLTRFVVGVVSE